MADETGKKSLPEAGAGIKRRGLLRFGTLVTAFTGASAISALGASDAQAASGDKNPPNTYVPIAEKGVASGVATLDLESRIPPAQLPDLSATYGPTAEGMRAAFVSRPTASEVTYFVTPRGDDANDGLTIMTAKATIGSAIAAAGGSRPRIQLGVGSFSVVAGILYPYGTVFVGAGSALTTLTFTGTGTLFAPASPGFRTCYPVFEGMTIQGPGKETATVGISLDSVTDASLKDIVVRLFGIGVQIGSSVPGGAVYNHLDHITASSCGVGFRIEASGSNATKLVGCRANACFIGLEISDSNNTNWIAGSFERNSIGVQVSATSNALADQNMVTFARFEGNTTAWAVTSSNVRDFQILYPATFGAYIINDLGTRTTQWGNNPVTCKTSSSVASATGSWRFERVINGGAELPALNVVDSVTTTGTPVTLQIETERAAGYFLRGRRGGKTHFEVRADGMISGGASATGARPSGVIPAGSQWFDTTLGKPIWYSGTAWVDALGKLA
jgi:hypothetical protein